MEEPKRPGFVDAIDRAYRLRKKGVVVLTGNVRDLCWSPTTQSFLPLEQSLYQVFMKAFTLVRLDHAGGLSFYDKRDLADVQEVCRKADTLELDEKEHFGNIEGALAACRHQPLAALVLLRNLSEAIDRVRTTKPPVGAEKPKVKPLMCLVQYAGALFPSGDIGRLSELDRQRLVVFEDWIQDLRLNRSHNLIVVVSPTRAELNSRIITQPATENVEIALPDAEIREWFTTHFTNGRKDKDSVRFEYENGIPDFVQDSAGLKLTDIEDMLEVASGTGEPVTRSMVIEQVNRKLEEELGGIVKVKRPKHGPKDVIGHAATGQILAKVLKRCEDPSNAVSAILVAGPNGGGKTYQVEAHAGECGRLVIELAGLRNMYFGETDRFFEVFLWHIRTYGKILILVDEAHTAFGSVHDSNTHETEKRLGGNIIKMMGDPTLLGKVVWVLMTSRPDELDPDVKSRAPIQIPIFDLEGEPRKEFIKGMFKRGGIEISDQDLDELIKTTGHYSSRDFNFLVREVRAAGEPVMEVMKWYRVSESIALNRKFQSLVAAQHCSYPQLLPDEFNKKKPEELRREALELQILLHE